VIRKANQLGGLRGRGGFGVYYGSASGEKVKVGGKNCSRRQGFRVRGTIVCEEVSQRGVGIRAFTAQYRKGRRMERREDRERVVDSRGVTERV